MSAGGWIIDRASRSTVVVCPGCGWRACTTRTDPVGPWQVAADHERRAHNGERAASDGLVTATRRARAAVGAG